MDRPAQRLRRWTALVLAGSLVFASPGPLRGRPVGANGDTGPRGAPPGETQAKPAAETDAISLLRSLSPRPFFVENRGQHPDPVRYIFQAADRTFFFTDDGVSIVATEAAHTPNGTDDASRPLPPEPKPRKAVSYRLSFVGANATQARGELPLATRINVFRGSDPNGWQRDIPTFGQLRYPNLYDGIDLVWRFEGRALKYDFIVQPGADPALIGVAYDGVDGLEVTEDGLLQVQTAAGKFQEMPPSAYQELDGTRAPVSVRFRLLRRVLGYGFTVESAYLSDRPLIIDPSVAFSTFLP